nr:MAG TPA: hypothetical protein [Caudoviricetes sp.]
MYRVAFFVKDKVDGIMVDADYYIKENNFVSFIRIGEDKDDDEVFTIRTEYLISISKI